MTVIRSPELAPQDLVRLCKHRLDAIRLCIQLSGLSHETIAKELSIDKGHWSRMMQGRANFPDQKSVELMQLCGNYAPMQYEAWRTGFDLVPQQSKARIRELEDELNKLRSIA